MEAWMSPRWFGGLQAHEALFFHMRERALLDSVAIGQWKLRQQVEPLQAWIIIDGDGPTDGAQVVGYSCLDFGGGGDQWCSHLRLGKSQPTQQDGEQCRQ